MRPDLRDRVVLPILLPLGIIVVMAGVLYGFSRILLSLTADTATATALVVAAAVVTTAGIAASRKQVRGSTIVAMVGAIAGVAMLAGGIALAVVAGEGEEGGEAPAVTVHLAAKDIAFQPTELSVPAGQPFVIDFDDKDVGVQHNVQIYATEDYSGTPLFDGELVTGPLHATYHVGALDPGPYFFKCVVHANMTGRIAAEEGAGPGSPGEPGGPGGGVTVTAASLAFDTSEIVLPADKPSTITFRNQDAGVQHNISIYSDPNLGQQLFQGELVTGPGQADYPIPPIPTGTYYFQCDVHPTMNGTVRDG